MMDDDDDDDDDLINYTICGEKAFEQKMCIFGFLYEVYLNSFSF